MCIYINRKYRYNLHIIRKNNLINFIISVSETI